MDILLKILSEYGVPGAILIVLLYIVLSGQIDFRYPRPGRKTKKD